MGHADHSTPGALSAPARGQLAVDALLLDSYLSLSANGAHPGAQAEEAASLSEN